MQEHLIVDGNNALHAIPEFARELKLDRARARESLLHFLEPLQVMGGYLLSVVFDDFCFLNFRKNIYAF